MHVIALLLGSPQTTEQTQRPIRCQQSFSPVVFQKTCDRHHSTTGVTLAIPVGGGFGIYTQLTGVPNPHSLDTTRPTNPPTTTRETVDGCLSLCSCTYLHKLRCRLCYFALHRLTAAA